MKRNRLGLVVVGSGLILVGVAAYFLLSRNQTEPSIQSELSSVPATVNYPAPGISLNDIHGNPESLADYRGRVVLVNLWATWCPPCKQEMPVFQTYYDQHKSNGFDIVAINDGDPTKDVMQFVDNYKLTFSVWLDPNYVATDKVFQTINLPSSYVIDRNGVVRLIWVGGITGDMLERYVTPIIME
ncbi:MAG TPA: redoxin domain-containing protein [Anaerolineales bacterium]|nr:redoxin domain-containing protein [Anaerolineales bacterium]